MNLVDLIERILSAQTIVATDKELMLDGHIYPLATSAEMFAMTFRRPPCDDTQVLGWNTRLKRWVSTSGIILNAQHDQLLGSDEFRKKVNDDPLMVGTGYFVSHWMFSPGGPE